MSTGSGTQLCNLSKPPFTEKEAADLVENVFGLKVSELKPLPSYDDENFYVRVAALEGKGENAEEFVLKIINCEDSQNPDLIEVQTQIMMFLNQEGFPVATPRFTKKGAIMFLESTAAPGSLSGCFKDLSRCYLETLSGPKQYMVRLLSYLPGRTVASVPVDPPLLYEIGQLAARLTKTLTEKFQHPLIKSLHRGEFIWNLANIPLLKQYILELGENSCLEVVKSVIEQFTVKIMPKLRFFRPSINHGDLNDHNILVDIDSASPDNLRYKVSGILDFSDMSYGYYVFEVAITIMYMIIESKDPLNVGGHVLAGFESIIPLTTEERDALFLLVCGRLTQSLVMAAHTSLLHPENKEYLMITAKTGWKHLVTLFEMGQEAVEKIWYETAKGYA